MFSVSKNLIGTKIADGFNSQIFEYGEQDPKKNNYLVKVMSAKSLRKLRQYQEEFALGFNNKHPFVLNYKGLDIEEVNVDDVKYTLYIKMKKMKKSLNMYLQELKSNEANPQHLPLKEVVWIFYSLASALLYLEAKGIVHSNVMTHAVLLDKNDTIKLGGFGFSRYKPWHHSERKVYQSYWPPERFSDSEKSQKVEKQNAFKSDVWCLGKLVVDICLLRDKIQKEASVEKINEKVKNDLEEVKKIKDQDQKTVYDGDFMNILEPLLNENLQERPNFKDICDALEKTYPHFELVKMKNRGGNEEVANFNITLPEIEKEDHIESEHSFDQLETDAIQELGKISEEQETMEKNMEVMKAIILGFQNSFQNCELDIKAKIKKVVDHKVAHDDISRENPIPGFLTKSETLLETLDASFKALEQNRQKIMTCFKRFVKDEPFIVEESEINVAQSVQLGSTNDSMHQKQNTSEFNKLSKDYLSKDDSHFEPLSLAGGKENTSLIDKDPSV